MKTVLDSVEVVIGTRGIVHALQGLNVPMGLIEFIEENLDESDMLERKARVAHDTDLRA